MPTNPGLTLTILQPPINSTVKVNEPFTVSGTVTGPATPEPIGIVSIMVQVDHGPAVSAKFSIDHTNKNKSILVFTCTASVEVKGGLDPHTITVTVKSDRNVSVHATRDVFLDVPFAVSPPAILIELLNLVELNPRDGTLDDLAKSIQAQLADFSDKLVTHGLVLAGPNMFEAPQVDGQFALRIGFWIEDKTFPVMQPAPDSGFSLPVLPDKAAVAGLQLMGRLPVPPSSQLSPSFAVLVPQATLQKLANTALPDIRTEAGESDVSIDSITVKAVERKGTTDAHVSVKVAGDAEAGVRLPFTIDFDFYLGMKQIGKEFSLADPQRLVPTVARSTTLADQVSLIEILQQLIFPPFILLLQATGIILQDKAEDSGSDAETSLKEALESLSPLIPFSNAEFKAFQLPNPPSFPRLILNWLSFEPTNKGLLGTGFTIMDGRDDSMTHIVLDGQHTIMGNAADMAGSVDAGRYRFTFQNISDDPDLASGQWQLSGTGTGGGTLNLDSGSFKVRLPMPDKPEPGKAYPFTISATAVETSVLKPKQQLHASGSLNIKVEIKQARPQPGGPKPPQHPQ